MSNIRYVWITLNRQCNLRCQWCYANSTDYNKNDDISEETVNEIINFISEFGLEYVALIGGEPTCYPYLQKIINRIYHKGMKPVLITNGLSLSDKEYLGELISAGLYAVNLSMKGWSEESYFQNTGLHAYEKTLSAIRNVSKSELKQVVSYVINSNNVDKYFSAIADAVKNGANDFYFSFEQDFSILDGNTVPPDLFEIFRMIDCFSKNYNELCSITGGNFILHQSYPFCIWDSAFIEKMLLDKRIISSCQLLEKSGIIFDTNGYLLPCNSMYQTPIAKLGEDFICKQDFEEFWNSNRICKIYKKLSCLPGNKCNDCTKKLYCGGGCVANWFHYNINEMYDAYQVYKQYNSKHLVRENENN